MSFIKKESSNLKISFLLLKSILLCIVLGFSRETESIGHLFIYLSSIYRDIYLKELAHVITEAEKPHDLPSGDPGEPMGEVPF